MKLRLQFDSELGRGLALKHHRQTTSSFVGMSVGQLRKRWMESPSGVSKYIGLDLPGATLPLTPPSLSLSLTVILFLSHRHTVTQVAKKLLTVTERGTNLSQVCRPQTPKCHRLAPVSLTTPMFSVHASMIHEIQYIRRAESEARMKFHLNSKF